MSDRPERPHWRALRDDEMPRPGTVPYEIDGKLWVPNDDDEGDDEDAGAEEADAAAPPGNGADTVSAGTVTARVVALRDAATRLAAMDEDMRAVLRSEEAKRLGVRVVDLEAAIERALTARWDAEAAALAAQRAIEADPKDHLDLKMDDAPVETDEEAIRRLARMKSLDYERVRDAEAERLGCRTSILDKLVEAERGGEDDGKSARRVRIVEHEPSGMPEPLLPLLDDLVAAITRHVVLSKALANVVALWISHTWTYERFEHTPRLGVVSPIHRCGKSTLMALLRMLCRRTLKADGISAAGTFRIVEKLNPLTLLLDEADTFLNENEELRGVMNSGFEATGQVVRVVEIKGEHEAVGFATFCPLALAAIRRIPASLVDRAIPAEMQRKRPDEKVEKLRAKGNKARLADLGRRLARWAKDDGEKLSADPDAPEALNDREADISVPLLAIADQAGGPWPERGRKALLEVFQAAIVPEGDVGHRLLTDIRTVFGNNPDDRNIASAELCRLLAEVEEGPWLAYGKARKPITQTEVAGLLRPFKITSTTVRPDGGGRPAKGYKRSQFTDAWRRYIPSGGVNQPLHGYNPQKPSSFQPSGPLQGDPVVTGQTPKKPSNSAGHNGVTGKTPPLGNMNDTSAGNDVSEVLL
jgi:Protein of unknown function (DUF3631)